MICTDLRCIRPESSVPPKKSHYWRIEERTSAERNPTSLCNSKDSMPDSCETSPAYRRTHNISNSHNENCPVVSDMSIMRISASSEMPLDFSVKKSPSNQLSNHSQNGSHRSQSPSGSNKFSVLNISHRDHKLPSLSGGTKSEDFSNKHQKKVNVPNENAISHGSGTKRDSYEENKQYHMQRVQRPDPSIRIHSSPKGNSPSPPSSILKERLTRDSPGVSPVIRYPNGQSAYNNGFGSVFPQASIFNGVLADPVLFSPSDLLAQSPNMAFMAPQIGMLSHLPPPGILDMKTPGSRKFKHERPFKSYSLTLQEDYPMGYQVGLPQPTIDVVDAPQNHEPSASRSGPHPRSSPNSVSVITNSSSNSDSADVLHEAESNHNIPHSSVPNGSLSDTGDSLDGSGRKRKPVADSEKDENYWKKRVKNNLAAKRCREARRKKEDIIAQHAQYYRTQCIFFKEQARVQAVTLQEQKVKIATLENAYMNLAAENRMLKQAAAQKRCEQCGNRLSDLYLQYSYVDCLSQLR